MYSSCRRYYVKDACGRHVVLHATSTLCPLPLADNRRRPVLLFIVVFSSLDKIFLWFSSADGNIISVWIVWVHILRFVVVNVICINTFSEREMRLFCIWNSWEVCVVTFRRRLSMICLYDIYGTVFEKTWGSLSHTHMVMLTLCFTCICT